MRRAKELIFIAVLLISFIVADLLASFVMQPFFLRCGRFALSDFEIVQRDHPEETWDKVFFGNSVVISSFREDESDSGYINLGLDDGVITDLWEIIDKGYMNVGSELVIGLNSLTLYDDFETNPYYPWHKNWYEPYCYFERDRLSQLINETLGQFAGRSVNYDFIDQQKAVYYGAMSEEEILAHRSTEHYLPLLTLAEDDYKENFRALEKICSYCSENDIRLRLVWLPINPIIEVDDASACAYNMSKEFAKTHNIEFLDMTGMMDADCYYDGGHLNYQYGSHVFTEVIDPWLNK